MSKSVMVFLIAIQCVSALATEAPSRLILFDTGAIDSPADYTIGQELKDLEDGAKKGFQDTVIRFPKCRVVFERAVETESQQHFQERLLELKRSLGRGQKLALVGLSRSTNAKTAAQLLLKSDIFAISAGAAANLNSTNVNFFSVASSIERQWKEIKEIFTDQKCAKVEGLFSSLTGYSSMLKDYFVSEKTGRVAEESSSLLGGSQDCLFMGSNFSDSVTNLLYVLKAKKFKVVVGTGDWPLAGIELRKLLANEDTTIKVLAPSGWPQHGFTDLPGIAKVRSLVTEHSTPLLAYSYDAAVVATTALCASQSVPQIISNQNTSKFLIRLYSGILHGNFVSDFYVHSFSGKKALQ